MSALPPIGGIAPPLTCSRWTGGVLGSGNEEHCGQEAKWHIIWTSTMDNGLACDEHYEEARERWAFYAAHEYRPDCSMPGATFYVDENICIVDEDGLGLRELAMTAKVNQ